MYRILLCLVVAALGISPLARLNAAQAAPPPPQALLNLDEASRQVDAASLAKYRQIAADYSAAVRTRPGDAALAMARCRFMQNFSWSDELRWAEQAQKDLETCQQDLKARFGDEPEIALYLLQSVYGKAAVAQGTALLPKAGHWPEKDRAGLHAALSSAYQATQDTRNAGLQAVKAARLAPDTPVLLTAVRYLATTGQKDEAKRLLMNAPVPKTPWVANSFINTAHDLLPGTTAREVLQRMQKAGLKVDPYASARALLQAGDAAGAQRALAETAPQAATETPQNRALRLRVGLAAGDAKATEAALLASLEHERGNLWPLAQSYGVLLTIDPAAAFRPAFIGLLATLVFSVLLVAVSPGVLMFPAHYIGTVRARKGRPTVPLFDGIGLRHAWYGLAVLCVAIGIIPVLMAGQFTLRVGNNMPLLEPRIAIAHVVTLCVIMLALCVTVWRFGWRQWLGSGKWKVRWFIWPVILVALIALSGWVSARHLPTGVQVPQSAEVIARGAAQLGGPGFALLLLAVAVPIVEEFVFRGCLLGGLTRHMSFFASNLWQAVIFAAVHVDARRFLFYLLVGLTAGWLAKQTRGLAASILLHGVINAIFVVLVLAH
ncbi:type II CAAX endopeptidase family protein [Pandoraea bronchicola]|uniref:Abortive infection protein n=1 Tax=Pandoraea bronchicola TaxID=2508287 RepID=A0A5E5BNR9_9BURK|nr:type II CAAX endopeptidase family protein [Pandoraea bronchicola]VVE87489.1 abortive infection protein [Pandoraea bronchicola]